MTTAFPSLRNLAVAVLESPDPGDKVTLTGSAANAWRSGAVRELGDRLPPDRPARPTRPALLPPREMPKRRRRGMSGRIALLHAVAHIELNAVDLAWDLIARFASPGLPHRFVDDWVGVAADEARHFTLLEGRLGALGARYGDLPAHDGLWQAAEATADDLLARLAVVPMVLEARGLDVTPAMIADLESAGDGDSAHLLRIIYDDEIGHVAAGVRWFRHVAAERALTPESEWRRLIAARFRGSLKPPFDEAGRAAAGFDRAFYAG